MFCFVLVGGQAANIMFDVHGQMVKFYFFTQPVRIQAGIIDIVVDFLLYYIGARKSLSPSGSGQDNAMTGAVTDQHAGATGRIGVLRTSKNIPCFLVDDCKSV